MSLIDEERQREEEKKLPEETIKSLENIRNRENKEYVDTEGQKITYEASNRIKRDEMRDREETKLENDLYSLSQFKEKYPDMKFPIMNYDELWFMFPKERPTRRGETNRAKIQFTITPDTELSWRDFVEVFTGEKISRGRGVSSACGELALRMFMAVIAEFKVEDTVKKIRALLVGEYQKERIKENLHRLADKI